MNNLAKPIPERALRLTPQEEDHFLLALHLRRLLDADLKAACEALQMSQEHLPEMHLISLYKSRTNWAQAVMNSDSLHSLTVQPRTQQKMQELMQSLLETEDLQSLLEYLP